MATELVIKSWCDVCLAAGENTPGETLTIAAGVVPAFDVEVCPRHAKPLAEAVAVLAPLGRAPGKTVQPGARRPSRAAPGAATGKPDQKAGTGGTCPECQDGKAYRNRAALRTHVRNAHDKGLADIGLAEARFTCPECGGKFDAGQGLSAHTRLIHGIGTGAKQSA